MENQQNENFANCSQTSFAMRKFRKPVSQCENFANQNSQCENFAMRNFAMPKPSSQCQMQFRNAKIFAIPNSQCENFAKPISQCEIQFRSAKFNFAMPKHYSFVPTYAKFRIAKFTTTLRNFANPFRIAKFTLRNFQALSSSVINAEPPSIFGVLLF